jgi:hypothetical protein
VRPAAPGTGVNQSAPAAGADYEDFEIVGDADEDEPYEDLQIMQEGGREEVPEVLPASVEDLPSVLPAGPWAESELLRRQRLFIKGRPGGAADLFVSAPNSYVLYDPETRQKVG